MACFHLPGGPSTTARKGYAIAANEGVVAVEPSGEHDARQGRARAVVRRRADVQPAGRRTPQLVNLALDDEAKIGGTNMAVIVTPAKGGGNAIGVIYLDGKGQPIVGSYVVGISNHYVTIVKVTGPRRPRRSTATRRISPCASTPG